MSPLLSKHWAAKLSQVCYKESVDLEAHILYTFLIWHLANWHPPMKSNPGKQGCWGLMTLQKPTARAMLRGRLSCCQAFLSAPSWFLSSSTRIWLAVSNPLLALVGGLALLHLARAFGPFFYVLLMNLGSKPVVLHGNCPIDVIYHHSPKGDMILYFFHIDTFSCSGSTTGNLR